MSGCPRTLTRILNGRKVVNCQDEPDRKDTMRQELDEAHRAEFERLYNAYRLAVHGYCVRRTSHTDAADAVSETFLVAWRRFDDVAPEPDTLPYLYGIAAKVLSNLRRSSRRRSRLGLKLQALGVAPSTDPMTIVVRNSEQIEVEQAVRKLSRKDREIVMLYAWEELPRKQIAQAMGMSKPAVNPRIHRSYKRLARVLKPKMAVTHIKQVTPPIADKGGGV